MSGWLAAVLLVSWQEPPRVFPPTPQRCEVLGVRDGDTLDCERDGVRVRVRLRGVDTPERGEPGWAEARAELRERLAGCEVVIVPRHASHGRVVADVIACGTDVGRAMDRAGWSKPVGARR